MHFTMSIVRKKVHMSSKNVKVVSSRMVFDNDGRLISFEGIYQLFGDMWEIEKWVCLKMQLISIVTANLIEDADVKLFFLWINECHLKQNCPSESWSDKAVVKSSLTDHDDLKVVFSLGLLSVLVVGLMLQCSADDAFLCQVLWCHEIRKCLNGRIRDDIEKEVAFQGLCAMEIRSKELHNELCQVLHGYKQSTSCDANGQINAFILIEFLFKQRLEKRIRSKRHHKWGIYQLFGDMWRLENGFA
ncbi:uncharacterized protein LOC126668712 [Mercurialis annua]|uniref:uncharacterized protein LOC126668712 n=1 Tax=Mercurialis annua TaxID=3986 RepID=UPI0024ACC8EF|nr:uncharacterized protein LOC126668712 [Mercurialis annua]